MHGIDNMLTDSVELRLAIDRVRVRLVLQPQEWSITKAGLFCDYLPSMIAAGADPFLGGSTVLFTRPLRNLILEVDRVIHDILRERERANEEEKREEEEAEKEKKKKT